MQSEHLHDLYTTSEGPQILRTFAFFAFIIYYTQFKEKKNEKITFCADWVTFAHFMQ